MTIQQTVASEPDGKSEKKEIAGLNEQLVRLTTTIQFNLFIGIGILPKDTTNTT